MTSFLLSINPDLTPGYLLLFLIVAIVIGMSIAGLSGFGLAVVPVMALISGAKEPTGVILPMLIAAGIIIALITGSIPHSLNQSCLPSVDSSSIL